MDKNNVRTEEEKHLDQFGLLIGKRVSYSVTKQEFAQGVIIDKVLMKDKVTDGYAVTGYMILDEETQDVFKISYWRIHKIQPDLPKGGYSRRK